MEPSDMGVGSKTMNWKLSRQLAYRHRRGHGLDIALVDAEVRDSPRAASVCRCHYCRVAARVLIVDDHAGFRAAARAMLEVAGFEVVGEAPDGASALTAAVALRPSVVLLDIALPDTDGFAVCDRITATDDPPAVVLTSSRDAAEYADRLSTTSARGFVPKSRLSGAVVADLVG